METVDIDDKKSFWLCVKYLENEETFRVFVIKMAQECKRGYFLE